MGQQQSVHPVNFEELTDEQKAELIRHRIASGELDLGQDGVLPELPADTGMPRQTRHTRGSGIVLPEAIPAAPSHAQAHVSTRKRSSASVESMMETRQARSGSTAKLSGGDGSLEASPSRGAPAPDVHSGSKSHRAPALAAHVPAESRTEPTVAAAAAQAPVAAAAVADKKPRAPVAFAVNIAAAQEAFDAYCGIPGMYELLKPIGCGAYGAVYLARDPHTGQKVALKHIINAFTSITDARRIFREIKGHEAFHAPQHCQAAARRAPCQHALLRSHLLGVRADGN